MKKQDKEVLIISLIIILIIVFMAILLGVLAKPNEPHFKIMKEECWNETAILNNIGDCEERYVIDKRINSTGDYVYIQRLFCSHPIRYETKEICKQVEVEIVYPNDEYNRKINGILKEHITIEWLDENCECVELRCNEEYPIEQIDYDREDKFCCFHKDTIGKGICGVSLCSKYKCGEYFVEIWNQIK